MPKKSRALALVTLAAVLGSGLLVASMARAQDPGAADRIGVVDLGQVFREYDRARLLEEQINRERDEWDAREDAQRQRIQELNQQIEMLEPDSELYDVRVDERTIEATRLDLIKRRRQAELRERYEEYTYAILEDIQDVVQEYGQANGFSMVLKAETRERQGENQFLMGIRNVLYYSDRINITGDTLEILNARYNEGNDDLVVPQAEDQGAPPGPGAGNGGAAGNGDAGQ